MTDGNGFAFVANGEKPSRFPVMTQTQKMILRLMDWNNKTANESTQEMPLFIKVKLIGTYDDFLYGQGVETKIIERNNRLYVESLLLEHFKGKNDNELVYLKNGLFKIIDYPNLLQFDFVDGKATSVKLISRNMDTKIESIRKDK